MLPLALATLAAGAVALLPAPASATQSGPAPEALTRARMIRAEVNARYRMVPGRKLVVTEATTTGVVETVTLVTDWLEFPCVVPADNGIYFAICSARAKCPYPARSAARPAVAFLPRRQALELALRGVEAVYVEPIAGKLWWPERMTHDARARLERVRLARRERLGIAAPAGSAIEATTRPG